MVWKTECKSVGQVIVELHGMFKTECGSVGQMIVEVHGMLSTENKSVHQVITDAPRVGDRAQNNAFLISMEMQHNHSSAPSR